MYRYKTDRNNIFRKSFTALLYDWFFLLNNKQNNPPPPPTWILAKNPLFLNRLFNRIHTCSINTRYNCNKTIRIFWNIISNDTYNKICRFAWVLTAKRRNLIVTLVRVSDSGFSFENRPGRSCVHIELRVIGSRPGGGQISHGAKHYNARSPRKKKKTGSDLRKISGRKLVGAAEDNENERASQRWQKSTIIKFTGFADSDKDCCPSLFGLLINDLFYDNNIMTVIITR